MRTIFTILIFALICLLCGGLTKVSAQTVNYDSARDAHYAFLTADGDTTMKMYVQPVYYTLDTSADIRFQIWYSIDGVNYQPYLFGVFHIDGYDYANWSSWEYIFEWLGDEDRLNITYK
jgi:hypothetical protein